jgi:hypothetical protein
MAKRILLVAGGAYLLGFLGTFISAVMEIWDIGPSTYVFGEAFLRALVWPYEIIKLLM